MSELERPDTLKINEDYEKLVPPLSEKEYQELKESIRQDGLYYEVILKRTVTSWTDIIGLKFPGN